MNGSNQIIAPWVLQNLITRYKKLFDKTELTNKMSLSVQRSVVKSFIFKGKNVWSVHVPDVVQYLAAKDLLKVVDYNDDDNARRVARTYVPGRYRMGLGDAENVLRGRSVLTSFIQTQFY